METYKNHLQCLDLIPTFRQKDEPEPEKPAAVPQPEPVAIREPEPIKTAEPLHELPPEEPVVEAEAETIAEPAPEPRPEPEPRHMLPVQEYREQPAPRQPQPPRTVRERPAPQPSRGAPREGTGRQEQSQIRTLNDTYNYVQEQLQPSRLPESYLEDNDLSSVGIDLNAHSNIPEALRREKSTNYSNLPFGDGIDVDGRKRRR